MYIVGITGGIGSGKTITTNHFQVLGVKIIDADEESRKVVEPGMPALSRIEEYFGKEIMDGISLNRSKLREIIFSDSEKKIWLEKLLHPLINKSIVSSIKISTSEYTILVSPLLLETNQFEMCSRILIVDSDETKQIERTMIRDQVSKQHVSSIIESQIDRKQRLSKADDVIINDGSIESLKYKVELLHSKYLELCRK